ncbi:MAG: hypothetical protein J7M21_02985 [Planctomycetes bacterium]|nr:hypothetical protein [Planctomycetota bacterium]
MSEGRSRWKVKAVLVAVGVIVIAAGLLVWPKVSFWYARRQVLASLERLDPNSRAFLNFTLAAEEKVLPQAPPGPVRVSRAVGKWLYSLPADRWHLAAEPNRPNVMAGPKLRVCPIGAWDINLEFKPRFAPSRESVRNWLRSSDPYELLTEAYRTTPGDVEAAADLEQLQRKLYLLLLRSILQPVGSNKLWMRFRSGARRGFVAGDTTCRGILASFYLPRTRQFAEVLIIPAADANMADVWQCLTEVRFDPLPPASAPSGIPLLPLEPVSPTTGPGAASRPAAATGPAAGEQG